MKDKLMDLIKRYGSSCEDLAEIQCYLTNQFNRQEKIGMKVRKIEIEFPFKVELPPGFIRALSEFVNLICEKYQVENPDRVMWPAGQGSKPLWREPEEPEFDDDIFHIEIAEREKLMRNHKLYLKGKVK